MSTSILGYVKQQNYSNASDGAASSLAATREGALVVNSAQGLYDRWLRAGQVFEAHFATEAGTATIEANAAYDLTEPFFRMTCPSSKILVPIKFAFSSTVVKVTADSVMLLTSDTDTYNTGGAAPDVRNMAAVSSLDSALGTTAMTNIYDGDSVLTENALTNPRAIAHFEWLTGGLYTQFEYNILKGDPTVYIHGPASFLAAMQCNGALEVYYHVVWAELDKSALVNS